MPLSSHFPHSHLSAFRGHFNVQNLQVFILCLSVKILKGKAVIFITPNRELVSITLPCLVILFSMKSTLVTVERSISESYTVCLSLVEVDLISFISYCSIPPIFSILRSFFCSFSASVFKIAMILFTYFASSKEKLTWMPLFWIRISCYVTCLKR